MSFTISTALIDPYQRSFATRFESVSSTIIFKGKTKCVT